MSYFEFPHTRNYDGDLGYIIKKLEELNDKYDKFFAYNSIKFADPLEWDITKQYEAYVIVSNNELNKSYLSKVPVPAGISIFNEDYWELIGNFVIDYTLSASSNNPIANKAVTVRFNTVDTNINNLSTALAQETTNRTSAVTNLQTQITANANAISSEAATRANADNVLSGRIDNIITPVTVDSEVIDIRTGYTGKPYTSAGNAVRGQISEANSAISYGVNAYRYNNLTFTQGTYGSDGTITPAATTITATTYFPVGTVLEIIPKYNYSYTLAEWEYLGTTYSKMHLRCATYNKIIIEHPVQLWGVIKGSGSTISTSETDCLQLMLSMRTKKQIIMLLSPIILIYIGLIPFIHQTARLHLLQLISVLSPCTWQSALRLHFLHSPQVLRLL